MGRLFWKFFLSLWLAQIVTVAGVTAAIWVLHSGSEPVPFEARPPAAAAAPPAPQRPPPPPPEPGHRGRMALPWLPVLAGSLVSLVFAALLAAYFARPIRTLRDAFEAVAGGALDARTGPAMAGRRDELADLGKSFDHMAGRLQELLESRQRLMHDVSHELRSPLARLQAAVQLMEQQPERGLEFMARIQRDIGRMDTLVGELLDLARLDAGFAGNLAEPVDLTEVIAGIVEDATLETADSGSGLQLQLPAALPVRGNPELLHRALENVVRNALRHSPDGVPVLIAGSLQEDCVRLSVSDRGPGVAESELAAIFEAFHRGDSATRSGGYGLGLAIARSVVAAHGGRIFACNRAEGGLQVTFELPRA